MCLAYFSKIYSLEFGNKIHVLIVDHNLRKESYKEALKVKDILKERKIKSTILRWKGKIPKNNVQKKQTKSLASASGMFIHKAFEYNLKKKEWKPRKTNHNSGSIWKYAQTVGPAHEGAVTQPGAKNETHTYADI